MSLLRNSIKYRPWAEAELVSLRKLVVPTHPVASVYLCRHRGGDLDDAEDLHLRLHGLLTDLGQQGADEATVDAIRAHVRRLAPEYAEHAVFAAAGAVHFARSLPGAPPRDEARFAAPASVTPVLSWLAGRPAYVVVVIDRAGADITSVRCAGGASHTVAIVGPDDEIERNAPGGWSQPRYQRRAEDSWRHNAGAVLDAALAAARDVDARLMLVAGDVRAVQLLRDQLGRHQHEVTLHDLPGGRSPDGSADARHSAIAAVIAEEVENQTSRLLLRLRDQAGPVGLATEGAPATVAALAAGRVDTLLVVDEDIPRTAWFGEGALCSLQRPGADVADVPGRLADVAVRAALLTDADVWVIPPGHPDAPADGLGALCRYAPGEA